LARVTKSGLSAATSALLEDARGWGDRPADELVGRLGDRVWAVNALLRGVRRNDAPLPDTLPEDVRHFLMTEASTPPFLNRTRVLGAQAWAQRHLFQITVALFCASLPSAYAAAKGARVLLGTGRMQQDLDRRINETARFVLDILTPGSLEPSGASLSAIRKVRLVHAAVRPLVRGRISDEVPINQEDMLGTLTGFSVLVLRALRRMGVHVESSAAEDFYHLWRGVGSVMGVREELLPADLEEANVTADLIAERQFRASADGHILMAGLLRRMEEHVDLPGMRGSPRFLVRYLLGDRLADILAIPAADGSIAERLCMRGLARRPGLFGTLSELVGRRLLDAVVSAKLGGREPSFEMPTRVVASTVLPVRGS
jgi:hypothetical protein